MPLPFSICDTDALESDAAAAEEEEEDVVVVPEGETLTMTGTVLTVTFGAQCESIPDSSVLHFFCCNVC